MSSLSHLYSGKRDRWLNYVAATRSHYRRLLGAGSDPVAGSRILAWRRQLAERRRVLDV